VSLPKSSRWRWEQHTLAVPGAQIQGEKENGDERLKCEEKNPMYLSCLSGIDSIDFSSFIKPRLESCDLLWKRRPAACRRAKRLRPAAKGGDQAGSLADAGNHLAAEEGEQNTIQAAF